MLLGFTATIKYKKISYLVRPDPTTEIAKSQLILEGKAFSIDTKCFSLKNLSYIKKLYTKFGTIVDYFNQKDTLKVFCILKCYAFNILVTFSRQS